ncbi:hypothetical protein ABN702_16005 [Bacillus haimaensis]|uniref:hypothetical protein n=1 Tax=Bacillus haimaensis TaxID=3160967 RepID=UPI003AA92107
MNPISSKNINIYEKNLEMMKMRIIELERNNIKTRALSDAEIREKIRSIIIEETNKNY